MNDNSLKCPVCNSKMSGSICGNCGYARFFFPKVVPPNVEKFEQARVRIMQNANKRRLANTPAPEVVKSSDDTIIGTLVVRNLITDCTYVYPIFIGLNIYGSKETSYKDYRYIDPLELGVDIPDLMFEIKGSREGLVLLATQKFPLTQNRCRISGNIELDNDDYFFYSNLLSFNAVLFDVDTE